MIYQRIFAKLRPLLPGAVARGVRAAVTAVMTPVHFSAQSGHFKSALKSMAVDSEGKPTPWYTYPMIDFLRVKDFTGRSVLEFGAGQSTLWWAARAASVVALEADLKWQARVQGAAPANVTIHHVTDDLRGIEERLGDASFDIIIVDGLDRFAGCRVALDHVATGGAVILDNSEGHWGVRGSYPIMDLYRSRGFSRVDFYGYVPGVIMPQCTSLFFKDRCFLLDGVENPAIFVPIY